MMTRKDRMYVIAVAGFVAFATSGAMALIYLRFIN